MLSPFIPDQFLGVIPMFGEIPLGGGWSIWIGELYNVGVILGILYLIVSIRKQKLYYKNGLIKKHATYLLSGKTGKGKTRFMAQLARDTQSDTTIVVSNFFSGYASLYYSSFVDFCAIQRDIAILGIATNFEPDEQARIRKAFPGYFDIAPEIAKKVRKLKRKYDFLTLGDEFYSYLHNRNFMANFAKDSWKSLLSDLHQTRHANQTLILASQDADNLDYDLRQLAHNEIEVKSWLLDVLYWFDIYRYMSKHEQKAMGAEFVRSNRIPYFFFNFYLVAESVANMYQIFRHAFTHDYFWWKFQKKWGWFEFVAQKLPKKVSIFESYILDYNTRFNVRPDLNIYKPGYLFDFLIQREKKLDA